MEKEFIPYEQALELAKLNFNEKCFGYYGIENKLHFEISSNLDSNLTRRNFLSAPLYQQAFRWFREKYNYYYPIHRTTNNTNQVLYSIGPYVGNYFTYEKAELECLKKLIEIVINK